MDSGIERAYQLALEIAHREIGRLKSMSDGVPVEKDQLSDIADRLEHAVSVLKRVVEVQGN